MDNVTDRAQMISVAMDEPLWERVFTVSPLVVIGTREGEGFDLAPKHMATPMSWHRYFGFICTPAHNTYGNAIAAESFTVSYPHPDQITVASLTASPRKGGPGPDQPVLEQLPTLKAEKVDGVFLEDAYLMLECELDRVVDGLDENSLLIGRVVAAHVHREALRVSEGDDQRLIYDHPLLAYLHPGRFATIHESQAFPFPSGFKK